jgi:hypothetical protein
MAFLKNAQSYNSRISILSPIYELLLITPMQTMVFKECSQSYDSEFQFLHQYVTSSYNPDAKPF